jgi:hypothetical protein
MRKTELRVVGGSTTPPDQQREREQAFQNWLASAETAYLECRDGRHIFPGMTDRRTELELRYGVCFAEASCPRCGTTLQKVFGVRDGMIAGQRGRASYEYPDGYLLPREATGSGGSAMDKPHRAEVRLELAKRAFAAKGRNFDREVKADEAKMAKERKANEAAERKVATVSEIS